ncbi:Do family serine endopeptidase [uncultured Cohaesibacter sp.]|uniref:Do family serine endopeptidase n=1 Tax=uncultured Cohaesibacter sp. TaxID=1002546 RepID=UPI0029C683E0|nr:Do family serine endopeptidase [uncultured Cohaesibacter sp.]
MTLLQHILKLQLTGRRSWRGLLCLVALSFVGMFVLSVALNDGSAAAQEHETRHETKHGPTSVADLAERLTPAVVNISTISLVAAEGAIPIPEVPEGSPFKKFFDDYFDEDMAEMERKQSLQSLGSGFIVDAKGFIVTNYHVISEADRINVKFHDGSNHRAELIGYDNKTDLALLKVEADKPLPTVSFGGASELRVGDWVMAIGNPFGLGGSVSIGIVSARNRIINNGPYDDFIQTDAAINRGNSGGPLFDMFGNVVGVNTAIISPTGSSIGLGFAIPSDITERVVQQLRDYGEARRGWLGVRIQELSVDLAEGLGVSEVRGALITWVDQEGPAFKAGLRSGDVILAYGGHRIDRVRDLTRLVADTAAGQMVEIQLARKGQILSQKVVVAQLAEREQSREKPQIPQAEEPAVFGMSLSRLSVQQRRKHRLDADVEGVLVASVVPDSLADRKGIVAGMIILEVNQEIVASPERLVKRLAELQAAGKSTFLFLVAKPDGGELEFVSIKEAGDGRASK